MPGSVWELYCSLSICLNLFRFRVSACFAYDKTVINQRRVEKSAFENQSEENSVWILQWTTLLGIFCKIGFTLGATGAETSLLSTAYILHWIVLTLSTLQMCIKLVIVVAITLLWLHHNHKKSISYHNNGLVSSHQSVGRWFIWKKLLCSKNILRKLVGYQQPTCPCVKMEYVVGNILLSCELYSLWWSRFRSREVGRTVYGNMCSAVEIAWLAQNIRHSSTRVWLHPQWRLGIL